MNIKKISKYAEFLQTKIKVLYKQKYYRHKDVVLKYMLEEAPSDTLIVVFSARTREGLRARYNYVRTLKPVNTNQLFILDDFAEDHRGAYYLGKNMEFTIEEATHGLIQKVQKDLNIKNLIFCGSSRGGWASLNFGLHYEHANMIPGGPQYYLGQYLAEHGEVALRYITGDCNVDAMKVLDNHLRNKILRKEFNSSQKIYIHYSDSEHTYEEHIKGMLEDLKSCKYELVEDRADYKEHSDISYHYPQFLIDSIQQIENENRRCYV